MKLFKCQFCGNIVYFENHSCEVCGHRLAYGPARTEMTAIEPLGDNWWKPLNAPEQKRLLCVNAQYDACNWFVPDGTTDAFCVACRHNAVVPDLSAPANRAAWQVLEMSKHRLFYSLLRLGLPLKTVIEDPEHGLSFEFLADPPLQGAPKVMTGHDNGRITIALAEADDAERERRRVAMGEPYRTLLGHFRHEIGHYYWDVLVRDGGKLEPCRAMFGDDSEDYGAALQRHYAEGSPPNWQDNFVSQYATSHPWEDFAETWAHYLHIVDTLEMVAASGMSVRPKVDDTGEFAAKVTFDPYRAESIEQIIDAWLPYVFAMNNVSRAIGARDLYPFVLSPAVIRKLGFIHELVHEGRAREAPATSLADALLGGLLPWKRKTR
ncbi:putative zinc-binding peptidase [Pseudolabrys sp. Root1462]|uniref:zinc-binding metallopeptidase family protein n=1 Tax=Pseudolabrys sp. Root1462 TaxID=1736466 RepID=UPI0009EBF60E|nr:putative zinc-binding peptidase [Pseudolabrys sp. Root1462]